MSRMSRALRTVADGSRIQTFDVVCAGEALWALAPEADAASARIRPGGGAVNAAIALARQGLHVGLATVLADDTVGRSLRDTIAAANVDTAGVVLSEPTSGLFFVEGGARQVVPFREEERPVAIPEGWSSQLLLLSGMSPVVAHAAALCKAARAARRAGTLVVVDLNARWELWKGRDARAIRMILREADVVVCSGADLLGLNMDVPAIRSAMRANAVLAMADGMGTVWAAGPFGKVLRTAKARGEHLQYRDGDELTTTICDELARTGHTGANDLWPRAIERALAAMSARR